MVAKIYRLAVKLKLLMLVNMACTYFIFSATGFSEISGPSSQYGTQGELQNCMLSSNINITVADIINTV